MRGRYYHTNRCHFDEDDYQRGSSINEDDYQRSSSINANDRAISGNCETLGEMRWYRLDGTNTMRQRCCMRPSI